MPVRRDRKGLQDPGFVTVPIRQWVIDEAASAQPTEPTERSASPAQVTFERLVLTPAALPWRQRQVADLEAKHGSPLPLAQIVYRLRRLDPWKFGQPSRYAVVYARVAKGRATLRASKPAATNAATLLRDVGAAALLRPGLIALAVLLVSLSLVFMAATTAWGRREDTAGVLTDMERQVTVSTRSAASLALRKRQARILEAVGASTRSPKQLLEDLAWVTQHRRSDVPVTAFHWEHGVSAIEVPTAQSPFADVDRSIERAAKPLRSGAWLWGVGRKTGGFQPTGER